MARYKIEGKWLRIPICGCFDVDVKNGTIKRWKDYFDYSKCASWNAVNSCSNRRNAAYSAAAPTASQRRLLL